MNATAPPSILPRLIRPRALAQRLGVSTTTLWRLRQRHELPEPIRISRGAVGWRETDVERWLAQREKVSA